MLGANRGGGLFQDQLSHGTGGVSGEWVAPMLLEPYVGPFGAFLVLFLGFARAPDFPITDFPAVGFGIPAVQILSIENG